VKIYFFALHLTRGVNLFVACGASLREVEGNLTGPTTLPFNQTSYVCHWKLQPPENMIGQFNGTGLTLTLRVIGNMSGHESNIKKKCFSTQYIELHGKRYHFIFYRWQLLEKIKNQKPMLQIWISRIKYDCQIADIGMLCGNITEPKYIRSPKLVNDLTVMYY